MENLIDQLPAPFLLLMAFTGYSPIWGDRSLDVESQITEYFNDTNDIVLTNDVKCFHRCNDSGSHHAKTVYQCSLSKQCRYIKKKNRKRESWLFYINDIESKAAVRAGRKKRFES